MRSDQSCDGTRVARRRSKPAMALALAVLGGAILLPATASRADTGDQIDQVQAQIAALQVQSEAATEAYDTGRIAQASSQRAAAAADAAVVRERAALDAQTGMARSLAAQEYRDGGVGKLLTLVGSGNPSAFLEQASTLSSISTTQAQQIEGLQAAAKQLSDAQTLDAAKQVAVKQAGDALAAAAAHVQDLITQQNQILSGLQAKQRAELAARQAAAEKAAAAAANADRIAAQQQAAAAQATAATQAAATSVNSTVTASPGSADPSLPSPSGSADPSPAAVSPPPVIPSDDRASVALSAAYAEIGKPYVYGAAGPDAFDCSGLMMWVFAKAGIALPHSAAGQYGYGTHVSLSQLEPGDIVFFDEGGGIGHDGIYAGNGTMVDAPHTGSTVGVHALYPGFVGGTRL